MHLRVTASQPEKLISITELLQAEYVLLRLEGEPWALMVCSFCGTDNRAENHFCGMCGVRLERRMYDRRISPDAVQLKCPSCNAVNEAGYKFCGQCGARIDRRINERRGSAADARATAGANASLPTPDDVRWRKSGPSVAISSDRESDLLSPPANLSPGIFVSDARREDLRHNEVVRDELAREELRRDKSLRNAPSRPAGRENEIGESSLHGTGFKPGDRSVIMGPSFLGLGNDSETEGEYLLEDESGSGAGVRRFILVLVLAAIIGLIFMQWRSSLRANPKMPEPAPSAAPARQGKALAPPSATAPSGQNQAGQEQSDPGTVSAYSSKTGNEPNASIDGSTTPKTSQTDPLIRGDDPGVLPNAADRNPAEAANTNDASSKTNDVAKTDDPAKAAAAASSADKADISKPAADDPAGVYQTSPSRPSATLLRAQQFLQGRGVPQNCEQGLIYLRAAAQKNEPAAAVQMGALYSSGHCVRQDRVMAYRWFNSAHELQPANQWIQKSMDQLWAQMNEQERRLSGY